MYGKKSNLLLAVLALLSVAGHRDRRPERGELLQEAARLRQAVDRLGYQLDSHFASNHLRGDAQRFGRVAADLERAVAGERRRAIAESLRRVEDCYYAFRHRFHATLSLTHGHDEWYAELMRSWLEVVDSSWRLQRISRQRPPEDHFDTPANGWIELRCKSEDFRPAECRLPATIVDLQLVKQKSRAACVAGHTYGYDRNLLWVNEGCDGQFLVRIR